MGKEQKGLAAGTERARFFEQPSAQLRTATAITLQQTLPDASRPAAAMEIVRRIGQQRLGFSQRAAGFVQTPLSELLLCQGITPIQDELWDVRIELIRVLGLSQIIQSLVISLPLQTTYPGQH